MASSGRKTGVFMNRDLQRLAGEEFDLLVIGGGISGVTIAWDAVLRGLTVALVDKEDFGGATSSATGKLIHGGLRYLKNFELGVVRESLRERRLMEFIAPHMVNPLEFVIPNYSWMDTLMLKAGMTLYDMLGFDKKKLDDPDKRIPGHRLISRSGVLDLFPSLPQEDLKNGYVYYDCQMVSPERLTLSFADCANRRGVCIANYVRVTGFNMDGEHIRATKVRDELTGDDFEIRAKVVLNATGCWGDKLLELLTRGESKTKLGRSKGIHIVIPSINDRAALGIITKTKRHIYLLPWRGLTLCGTTDTPYRDDPDDLNIKKEEILDFIDEINGCYPALNVQFSDVLSSYSGLRPLADPDGLIEDSYDASRKHELIDHKEEGLADNLLSALGGKYTTSRFMAMQSVDAVMGKLGRKEFSRTDKVRLDIAPEIAMSRYRADAKGKVDGIDDALTDHLITMYGQDWRKIAEMASADPALKEPVWDRSQEIAAQIVYAAEHEDAVHLEDAVYRRTDLCTIKVPGRDILEKCARLMAGTLGWNEEQIASEIERTEKKLSRKCAD